MYSILQKLESIENKLMPMYRGIVNMSSDKIEIHVDHLIYVVFVGSDTGNTWMLANDTQDKAVKEFIKMKPKLTSNEIQQVFNYRFVVRPPIPTHPHESIFMQSLQNQIWREVKYIPLNVADLLGRAEKYE